MSHSEGGPTHNKWQSVAHRVERCDGGGCGGSLTISVFDSICRLVGVMMCHVCGGGMCGGRLCGGSAALTVSERFCYVAGGGQVAYCEKVLDRGLCGRSSPYC